MARTLLASFDVVYVVTLPTARLPPELIDENLGSAERGDDRLRIISVAPQLGGYGIVAKPRPIDRMIGAMLTRIFCSNGADWTLPLPKVLNAIDSEAEVKLIVSTGGPYVPFVPVTAYARRRGIPCIIDYRDLWTQNPRAPYPWLFRHLIRTTLERYVNRRCSLITTVSEGCRASLAQIAPRTPIRTLLNTPDQQYVEWFRAQPSHTELLKSEELNIVLSGTVYRECTCRLLLRALRQLPEASRQRVRVHYFGMSARLVEDEFSEAGMSDRLVSHGFVAKQAAVAAVKEADILLSLVFDQPEAPKTAAVLGLMTTKVFDYFLSGKPIVNVGPEEADVCILARSIGYQEFHTFESAEQARLAEFLQSALADLPGFRQRRSPAALPDFGHEFTRIVRDVCRND